MAFSRDKLEAKLKSSGHVPALICLQIIFIALFARFVVYDPNTAVHSSVAVVKGQEMLGTYPSKTLVIYNVSHQNCTACPAKTCPYLGVTFDGTRSIIFGL